MPTTGYVAMTLGVVFSLLVGFALMALLFYSSRHGYDDRASERQPRVRRRARLSRACAAPVARLNALGDLSSFSGPQPPATIGERA